MCVPTGLITRGATGGERVLEARSTSCISYFGYEHVSKIRRNTFNTLTKAMYYLILLIIHIPAPPPLKITQLRLCCSPATMPFTYRTLPAKVVWVTAIAPYVILTCLLIRGQSEVFMQKNILTLWSNYYNILIGSFFIKIDENLQYSHWILLSN